MHHHPRLTTSLRQRRDFIAASCSRLTSLTPRRTGANFCWSMGPPITSCSASRSNANLRPSCFQQSFSFPLFPHDRCPSSRPIVSAHKLNCNSALSPQRTAPHLLSVHWHLNLFPAFRVCQH
ncbi:uncharacterized protein M421DRAFT_181994 [Didymella exigua CBS 183.55]|uniref:Uncharacterized protein n=1 Tax=Didymella exigua CBS 183.55 TaxID=1150837 RepID=A0A6A5RHT1_9PLEO|nr:uncharacterized protein M421DRAFT_181994 [Didymella exigua CBS 183.55]KAF1927119.1 hypothetical protein M421DRAFT_181994 [Didymella exigua CBS 183.55]